MRALLALCLLVPLLSPLADAQAPGPWRRLDLTLDPDAGIILVSDGHDLLLFSETSVYRIDPVSVSMVRHNVTMPDPALHLGEGFWTGAEAYLNAGVAVPAIDPPLFPIPPLRVIRYNPHAGAYEEVNVTGGQMSGGLFVWNGTHALGFGSERPGRPSNVSWYDPRQGVAGTLELRMPADLAAAAGGWTDAGVVLLARSQPRDGAWGRDPPMHLVRFDPRAGTVESTPLPHVGEPWASAWDGEKLWSVTPHEVFAVDPQTRVMDWFSTPPTERLHRCVASSGRLHCTQLTHDGKGNRSIRLWSFDPTLDTSVRIAPPGSDVPGTSPPQRRIVLRDHEYELMPAIVMAGTRVTWLNLAHENHTVTADDGRFASPVLARGDRFSFDIPVNASGRLSYHCMVHGERGAIYVLNATRDEPKREPVASSPAAPTAPGSPTAPGAPASPSSVPVSPPEPVRGVPAPGVGAALVALAVAVVSRRAIRG